MKNYVFLALTFLCVACTSNPKKVSSVTGYDAELTNFDYPFPVHYFQFESQNQKLRMAYIHEKAVSPNGKTIVLLHGKNFASWYWQRTITELLKHGFNVVAVDQIGFGKSSKPQAYQFTFQTLAANTRALLKSIGVDQAAVVGHSMGGMVAVRLALMFPDLASQLVLVNTIGLEDWKTMTPYQSVDQLYAAELKQDAGKIREYQRQAYFAGDWKPEYEEMIKVAVGWTLHPDYPKVAWNNALTSEMVFTQPVVYEFPLLKAKTLLIIGTRDKTAIGRDRAPKATAEKMGRYDLLGRKAAKAIPGAKLVELKNVGHVPQVEAFDDYLKAMMDFVKAN